MVKKEVENELPCGEGSRSTLSVVQNCSRFDRRKPPGLNGFECHVRNSSGLYESHLYQKSDTVR